MPTFDIVSKFDIQEVDNTINMVSRDILNRYDFKGSSAKLTLNKTDKTIKLEADNDMQLNTIRDMLENRAINRKLSIKIIKIESNISINYFMELKNCCRKGFNEQKHLRNQK